MRVLHLYAGNLYGGVETFLATLARHQSLSSMQSTVGLCFEGRLSKELREIGAVVEMLGEVRFSRPWTVLSARRKLRALLTREKFELVICHSPWPHAAFAPWVRRANLPLVFWAHNPPARHWLDRLAARTPPDLLVANSAFTLSAHDWLFSACEKTVLRVPVSAPQIADREIVRREVRRELPTSDGDVVIVCASRLESWKGHRLLLDALAKLKEVPAWTCWIAGGVQRESERGYLAELESQVLRDGLKSRVKFIGQRNDIPRILSAADMHCQPNTGPEPFGIAFIEALYAGLPVVTTRMGAAPEIVTEDCGMLVRPDATELSDALRDLIGAPDCRLRLGAACPKRAKELCDPEVTMLGIENVLRKLL